MLLCNKEIKREDLTAIAPHLWLNSTDILISKNNLMVLAELFPEYDSIIKEISEQRFESMYCLNEGGIKEIFSKYLSSEKFPEFITNLRYYSYTKRYNRISSTADQTIRNLLAGKGYF